MDRFSLRILGYCLLALTLFRGNANATPLGCQAPPPKAQPLLPGIHVSACTALDSTAYPPTSGRHFGAWADFKIYTQPVTPGYWLHSAEHGAVVILYNCPQGCPQAIEAITTLIHSLPQDPLCLSTSSNKTERRVILAPDRRMDSTFAMVAWGWSLTTNCLDTAAMRAFYTDHFGKATENLCYSGVDSSSSHWCNEPTVGIKSKARGLHMDRGMHLDRGVLPSGILWEGSLSERVQLSLEISTATGTRLKTVPLGLAGPGPAQAVWKNSFCQNASTSCATGVLCRVVSTGSGSGSHVLVEKFILPFRP